MEICNIQLTYIFIIYFSASLIIAQAQFGSDIDGEASGDFYGRSVSIDFNRDPIGISGYSNDGTGKLVGTLFNERITAGQHQYTWQPREQAMRTYSLRLITANQTFPQKVTYLK